MDNYTKEFMLSLYDDEDKEKMIKIQELNTSARSRVDEIIKYAQKLGYKKIGIAHCISFMSEAMKLEEILSEFFEVVKVNCKVGRLPKGDLVKNGFGPVCNPILQAEVLNEAKTDINIVLGLCVGHDILFYKYSKAPSTTLLVKDEINNNDPLKGLF